MRKTKLVALLLAVALIVSMVVPGVYAEDSYTVSIVDNTTGEATINANAGDTITLRLDLSNNPGISSVGVEVTLPTGWKIDAHQDKELFATANTTPIFSEDYVNPYFLSWTMATGTKGDAFNGIPGGKLSFENGTLALLQITIPADAVSGDYDITLNTTEGRPANFNYVLKTDEFGTVLKGTDHDDLTLATQNCTIIVADEEAAAVKCEKCGGVTWIDVAEGDWNSETALPANHYKLTGDQNLTAPLTVAADQTVCIDLNGYKITASGAYRTFNNTGTLVIMDSSEKKNGAIRGGGDLETPALNANSGANILTNGDLYIYGGTISGGKTVAADSNGYVGTSGKYGGNIYLDDGNVYIYGGTITGGTAQRGGNIYADNGNVYIYGGTITEGNANRGGNIYSDADVHIYGGTVSKGIANYGGGNLFVASASSGTYNPNVLNIYGGNILDGAASSARGSIFNLYSNVNIYGGNINNANGEKLNGDAFTEVLDGTGKTTHNANTYIYGGTITGTLGLSESISSTPEKYQGTSRIYNGVFSADVSAYLADCACAYGDIVWNYKYNDRSCTDCLYADALADDTKGTYITQLTGMHSPIADGNSTTGYSYCHTGEEAPTKTGECTHEGCEGEPTWLPWSGGASSGHYYVKDDFTLPAATVTVANDQTLCLDLNGKTVTGVDGVRMFEVTGTLNLMDSSTEKTGTLQGTEVADSGAVVYSTGNFNLYSGTIQGGYAHKASGAIYAGNVYIDGGAFDMTGGTIKDGKVENDSTDTANQNGGNIYITGSKTTATISGGTIEGGYAGYRGGNIAVNTKAKLTISGTASIGDGTAVDSAELLFAGSGTVVKIESGATIGGDADATTDFRKHSEGTLEIYGGVTLETDGKEFLAEGAQLFDASAAKYVTCETLAAALEKVEEGDIIALGATATVEEQIDVIGYTLDLNGKELTATVDASMDGNVVDSADVKGKVVGDVTTDNNEMLHVVVPNENGNENYFEEVKIGNKPDRDVKFEVGKDTAKYTVYVDMDKGNTKIDEALVAGTVVLSVDVTWTVNGTPTTESFALENDALIAAYVDSFNTKMLMVTISNIPDDVEALSCEFKIEKPPVQETVE